AKAAQAGGENRESAPGRGNEESQNRKPTLSTLVLLNQRGDNLLDIRWRLADMSTATLPRIRKASFRIDTTKSHEWLKAHRHEYIAKWVVLDGDRLVGAG